MKIVTILLCLFSMNAIADKHKNHLTMTYATVIKNKDYDKLFHTHGNEKSIYTSPKRLKALCGVESKLNPKARSKEHASGLCQIMPSTWRALSKKNHSIPRGGQFNANHSIKAASILLADISDSLNDLSEGQNKNKIILASYNAGLGNIRKAMKRCGSKIFDKIKQCLPAITSKSNANQTIQYVTSVEGLYLLLD